jgi:hypothetical protein
MFQHLTIPKALAAVLCAGLLVSVLRADDSSSSNGALIAKASNLATRLAFIPAGADPASVRFESVKMVEIPASIKYATDATSCAERAFRDPDGSNSCSYPTVETRARAYRVTYSFSGQPLSSDEYTNRQFSFHVYFQENELSPEALKALSAKKRNRAEIAALFAISTGRASVTRAAVDNVQSSFCNGNSIDGLWTPTDANCKDNIHSKTVTAPSDSTVVSIDPVSSPVRQAGIVPAWHPVQ